ncbi:hypothetical protein PQO01_09400 [Lentisphaera marina]|uniref:hypothetical protein n=1 Tax=Lentisphaera marina TaxID=1111041 RepID=UPI0023658980|nr:hypothetical protein [Lentisphaera marina]MDD7985164.1 hypothetical protein [Lentisphaera marina]
MPWGRRKGQAVQKRTSREEGTWISSGTGDHAIQHSNKRAEPAHPNVEMVKIRKKKKPRNKDKKK